MYSAYVVFTELNEIPDDLGESVATSNLRVKRATDTSCDEASCCPVLRNDMSEKTHKMKKSHAADELERFFATRPTDAASKPSHFFEGFAAKVFWR